MISLWQVGGPEWFVHAQKISQPAVRLDLHRHVAVQPAITSPADALAQLAPAAAVVSGWGRWQPSMIHAALQAGAAMTGIAAGTRLNHGEVVHQWWHWADVQSRIDIGGCPAIDVVEVRTLRGRLASGVKR